MKIRRFVDIEVAGIGARIKEVRKADGRSVEVLAREANISRSYWHDIEAERVRDALPEDTLRKIEQVLGVDLGVNFQMGSYRQYTPIRKMQDMDFAALIAAAGGDVNSSDSRKFLEKLLELLVENIAKKDI